MQQVENNRPCWFVGAAYGGTEDQFDRFIEAGIWETGYKDKYVDLIKSVKEGDRIAIKAAYTKKKNLPFEGNGNTASVMAIKAIGVVTKNFDDGCKLSVDWKVLPQKKEWYFYTHRSTIWKVAPTSWYAEELIAFTFEDQPQAYEKFTQDAYWKDRFGPREVGNLKFQWTKFYEEVASNLLKYQDRRGDLLDQLYVLAEQVEGIGNLTDRVEVDQKGRLKDICPFTVMGIFNRGLTDQNRIRIAQGVAEILEVETPVPSSFEGLPVLNNQRSWFFGYEYVRNESDIDQLWHFYRVAISYADDESVTNEEFIEAYDQVLDQYSVKWNLTMGLFWIRPWSYVTLDGKSQTFIEHRLEIPIPRDHDKKCCSGENFLWIRDELAKRFEDDSSVLKTFPELSLAAWEAVDSTTKDMGGDSWRDEVARLIELLCEEKGCNEFSRQEFIQCYLRQLSERYPDNNTIPQSITKQFILLKQSGELEQVSDGVYRWIGAEWLEKELVDTEPMCSPYSLDLIFEDGCFAKRELVEKAFAQLGKKKNLILQGAPGTGKTWLSKRLAYALIGEKNDQNIIAIQFHPNLSYEDFVRGWRPDGEGGLKLVDGAFLEAVKTARDNANTPVVVVIEEINRGNPAQIFGELLTLLEANKRSKEHALRLSYSEATEAALFLPENLYVIGTMNIADRSLALVDYAFRRRFAFVTLQPEFNEFWSKWVEKQCPEHADKVVSIKQRVCKLNQMISEDGALGKPFQLGHSYLTPTESLTEIEQWYMQIVDTEIMPLLEEYWFDQLEKVEEAKGILLEAS